MEAQYRFFNRVSAEMDGLLAFCGKEHKVIKRAEAQDLADTLTGSDMAILHGEDFSSSASLSALAEPVGTEEGIYTPVGEVPAEWVDANDDADVPNIETSDSGNSTATINQKFIGVAEGKSSLK